MPRQGQASATEGSERRALFVCNANPAKAGGGVTESRLRASNVASNRRAPGLQQWKASRSWRARCPSRGGVRARTFGRLTWARGESPASRQTRRPTTMGCSSSLGEGEPLATSTCGVAFRGKGRSFAPGGSTHAIHRRRFNPISAQPVRGSWCRPQAVLRRTAAFVVRSFGRLAAPTGGASMDLGGSLPARLEREGLPHAARSRKGSRGKRGQTRRAAWLQKSLTFMAERGSDARGVCPRVVIVSLQKSTGSAGPREAYALHLTRFGLRTGTGV